MPALTILCVTGKVCSFFEIVVMQNVPYLLMLLLGEIGPWLAGGMIDFFLAGIMVIRVGLPEISVFHTGYPLKDRYDRFPTIAASCRKNVCE
jgi:hypothetical protein